MRGEAFNATHSLTPGHFEQRGWKDPHAKRGARIAWGAVIGALLGVALGNGEEAVAVLGMGLGALVGWLSGHSRREGKQ